MEDASVKMYAPESELSAPWDLNVQALEQMRNFGVAIAAETAAERKAAQDQAQEILQQFGVPDVTNKQAATQERQAAKEQAVCARLEELERDAVAENYPLDKTNIAAHDEEKSNKDTVVTPPQCEIEGPRRPSSSRDSAASLLRPSPTFSAFKRVPSLSGFKLPPPNTGPKLLPPHCQST
eukprot:2112829-Ditylum_brightwellii.AAC.1